MGSLLAIGLFVVLLTWLLAPARYGSGGRRSAETVRPTGGGGGELPRECASGAEGRARRGVVLVCAVCFLAGGFLRLYGFGRSLWLDEFGTLWAIEAGLGEVFERALWFHGQSPLYYAVLWPVVRFLGESEVAIRVPSLLFDAGALYFLYRAGREWAGRETGLLAASVACLTPVLVEAAVNARPYSLALLGESMALYGFVRAARRGDAIGRGMFVLGGAVLFGAHYVLALPLAGLVIAFFWERGLRRKYPPLKFVGDISTQILLAAPAMPHLIALQSRGAALSWLGAPDYFTVFETGGALLLLVTAGVAAGGKRPSGEELGPVATALWVAVAVHAGGLSLLAAWGVNLLDTRYLAALVPPAALLAAEGMLRVRWGVALIPAGYALALTALFFGMHFLISGSFSRAGRQDWREAVEVLNARMERSGAKLVLLRPGFVEAEGLLRGYADPILTAPLRSPGKQTPEWDIVPLTYRWDSDAREQYFESTVWPAVGMAATFYVLLCDHCYNETTGDYPNGVRSWIRSRFGSEFSERSIPAGRGILLFEYRRNAADGVGEGRSQRAPRPGSRNRPAPPTIGH